MAKSLDELIEYLLGEIALSGQFGCTPADFVGFVSKFYSDETTANCDTNAATRGTNPPEKCVVDQALLDKVWTWLSRHPDVSIGQDKKLNHLSLPQVQSQYVAAGSGEHLSELPANNAATGESSVVDVTTGSSMPAPSPDATQLPRVLVAEERMWHAICGHAKDSTRVFDSEFALLSVIAATRSHGIIQADLVKATGQDKRSVPKRTDALQRKGYIEKRAVHAKAQRTSRLTLRKFVVSDAERALIQDANDAQVDSMFAEAVDMQVLITKLFDILREKDLITRNDLKAVLDMTSLWRSRILSRMIRQFEGLGCLKRCRAASKASSTRVKSLHPCVKFLHEPSAQDLQHYYDIDQHASNTAADPPGTEPDEEDDEHDGIREADGEPAPDTLTEVERPTPQWNPSRSFTNQLAEIVHNSGTAGITNNDVAFNHSGLFTRKSVDKVLSQLSNQWWQTQPLHLRHMAIIRDMAVTGNRGHYDHLSFPNFARKVEQGASEWEAVLILHGGRAQKNKSAKGRNDVPKSLEVTVQRDEFGFPVARQPSAQYQAGAASFQDLLNVIKPDERRPRTTLVVEEQVELVRHASTDAEELPEQSLVGSRDPPTPIPDMINVASRVLSPAVRKPKYPSGKTRGRPRKFMKGTESFWQDQFQMARAQAHPRTSFSGQAGVMNDPSGLAVFAQRPVEFDETLVRAISKELPVPRMPPDITPAWVTQMQRVLDRSTDGLYITPRGKAFHSRRQVDTLSQRLILRSSRLYELSFFPRKSTPPVSSHTSSPPRSRPSNDRLPNTPESPRPAMSGARRNGKTTPARWEPTDIFRNEFYLPSSPTVTKTLVAGYEKPWCPVSVNREHDLPRIESDIPRKRGRPRTRMADDEDVEYVPPSKRALTVGFRNELQGKDVSSPSASKQSRKRKHTPPLAIRAQRRKVAQTTDDAVEGVPAESHAVRQNGLLRSIEDTLAKLETTIKDVRTTTEVAPTEESPGESPSSGRRAPTQATPSQVVELDDADQDSTSVEPSEAYRLVQELTAENPDQAQTVTDSSLPHLSSSAAALRQPSLDSDIWETSTEMVSKDQERERPRVKRGGPGLSSGSVALLRRKIIFDLVDSCAGAFPSSSMTLWRAFTTKWQQAGQPTKPDVKTPRLTVKNLCDSGKLKQITFAFKNKKGLMVTKSILARPDSSTTHGPVKELQQQMINADPLDFVPPELEIDPSVTKYKSRYGVSARMPAYAALEIMDQQVVTAADSTPSHKPPGPGKSKEKRQRKPVMRLEKPGGRKVLKSNANPPSVAVPPTTEDGLSGMRFRTLPPAKPIKFNTTVEIVAPAEASSTPSAANTPIVKHLERLRVRRWKRRGKTPSPPPAPPLPISLAAFLTEGIRKHSYADNTRKDSPGVRFDMEVDTVAFWEDLYPESFEQTLSEFAFINHIMTHVDDQPGFRQEFPITFTAPVTYDFAGNQLTNKANRPSDSHAPVHIELDNEHASDSERPPLKKRKRPATVARSLTQSVFESTPKVPRQRKRKRQSSILVDPSTKRVRSYKSHMQYSTNAAGELISLTGTHASPVKRARGVQYLRTLPAHVVYRLVIAVIVVRTLAGGLEKAVDWSIVARLFPSETEQFVKDRHATLRNRYRRDVHALTSSFQERYITAYERDEVPGINFDDLHCEENDWAGIVDWAVNHLDKKNLIAVQELPESKAGWLRGYDVSVDEQRGMRDLLAYNTNATNPKREEALGGMVSATPIPARKQQHSIKFVILSERDEHHPELTLAKSWVMATVLTPPTSFDAEKAAAKLASLASSPTKSEDLLDEAVKSLIRDKLITKQTKSSDLGDPHTITTVGSYQPSQKLLEALDSRRMIHASILRTAAAYKRDVLDLAFVPSGPGVVCLEKDGVVQDGWMVAICNLLAHGRIRVSTGADVPRTRYGIDWKTHGYETRLLDKKLLGFGVRVVPVPGRYIVGHPVETSLREIPRGEADEPRGRIPLWTDIHGGVQREMWESILAAVVGLVSTRVGIGEGELRRTLGGGLTTWEMGMVLDWAEEGDLVKKTTGGTGWETGEWWWMCCS